MSKDSVSPDDLEDFVQASARAMFFAHFAPNGTDLRDDEADHHWRRAFKDPWLRDARVAVDVVLEKLGIAKP